MGLQYDPYKALQAFPGQQPMFIQVSATGTCQTQLLLLGVSLGGSRERAVTVRCTASVAGSTQDSTLLPSLMISEVLSVVTPQPSLSGPIALCTASKSPTGYSYSLPLFHTSWYSLQQSKPTRVSMIGYAAELLPCHCF